VTALELRAGATRLVGAARVDPRALDATLRAQLAPAEAAALGIQPVAPIRLRIALHGPPRALRVRLRGSLRGARVALTGRIDLPARRGRVRFVAHDVRPSEIARGAPLLAFSGAFAFDGAVGERGGVEGRISVTDGSVQVRGLRFDRLRGAGRLQLDQPGEARVDALSGQLEGRRARKIETRAIIRWDRRALRMDVRRVILDENVAAGKIVYTRDPRTRRPRLTARAQSLSLSPSLVQELLRWRPARAWPGDALLTWTPDGYGLAFTLDTEGGWLEGVAQLRSDGGALDLPTVTVALRGNLLRGAARVHDGEIVASVEELVLEPWLVHALWAPLNPVTPFRIQGAVAGPPQALDLRLVASSGPSTVMVRGRVDAHARSFRLLAALDHFQMVHAQSFGHVTLEVSLLGRLVEGGVAGKLTVRHASGTIHGLPISTARLDVTLNGPRFHVDQVLVGVPGAVVEGKGGGTYRDFHVGYGVVITDALELRKVPHSLRLVIGLTALTPGRSVVGAVARHQGGKIVLTHHTIPPLFRFLNLLYHLLTGHPLHLTVR
jgi:hypothetical protein